MDAVLERMFEDLESSLVRELTEYFIQVKKLLISFVEEP